MPFKYAPPAAALFAPLAALPPALAAIAWNLLSLLVLGWAGVAFDSWARREGFALPPWAVAAGVGVVWQSLFLELFYGQVDLVMLGLLLAAVLVSAGNPARGGTALALAVFLKPTALLVLPWLVVHRRFRAVAWSLAAAAALCALFLLHYGGPGLVQETRAWAATLGRTTPPWVLGYNPQGLPTLLLAPFFPPDAVPPPAVLGLAQAAAAAVLVAAPLARGLRGPALFAALAFAAAFASPLAWRANFVLALPLVALLLSSRAGRWAALLVLAAETLACEPLLGADRARALLALRPVGVAFLVAWVGLLASPDAARRGPPRAAG